MVTRVSLSSHRKREARGGSTLSCKFEVGLIYLAFPPAQNFMAPMVQEYALTQRDTDHYVLLLVSTN